MKLNVKLFAAARQFAEQDSVEVELPAESHVADLREQLVERFPEMESLLRRAMFAIDAKYASDNTPLVEQADVACIPPVSGG